MDYDQSTALNITI